MSILKSMVDNLLGPSDPREARLARAREALQEGRYVDAAFQFRNAGEWRKAGDTYLEAAETSDGPFYRGSNSDNAMECYFKARYAPGVVRSFERLLWLGVSREKHFDLLVESRCVEELVESVVQRYKVGEVAGGDTDKRIGLCGLFRSLLGNGYLDSSEQLLLHYSNVVYPKCGLELTEAYVGHGRHRDALRVMKILDQIKVYQEKEIFDANAFALLGRRFYSAGEAAAAGEMVRRFYVQRSGYEANWVTDIGLEDTLFAFAEQWDPQAWGRHLLRSIIDATDNRVSVDVELGDRMAASLARCYELLGPRPYGENSEGGTSEWLRALSDYWRFRGRRRMASQWQDQFEADCQLAPDQIYCRECRSTLEKTWEICPVCSTEAARRFCKTCLQPLEVNWQACPVCRGKESVRRL